MFADYRTLVLQHYQQMKAANDLSSRLTRPTPGKIKEECLAICSERYLRKDEETLRRFFGQSGDLKTALQAIKRCKPDKFRPLLNFLKGETTNPDDKNIELLAWLIDFELRPYELGRKYDRIDPELSGNREEDFQRDEAQEEVISPEESGNSGERNYNMGPHQTFSGKPYSRFKTITVIASITILASTVALIYWLQDINKSPRMYLTGQEKCMYWAGDHYQPISCNQKLGDTLVMAFDSVRLHNLKKIINQDTISQNSIGKVYYIKINGRIEFYTAGGYHPVYPPLRLRPMTDHIFRKYILANQPE